ncbi:hypothetical protein Tco_0976084 [Tanacetum coccineum]|uniref:Uncharacterized protein n=1 Tax=Tanacetum coccineum TaxID=301880 RepID=A0ABQ5EGN3_9ASTR
MSTVHPEKIYTLTLSPYAHLFFDILSSLGLAAIKAVVATRAIIAGGRLAIYDGIDILNLSVGPKSSCCVDISVSKSRKRTQRNVTSEAPPQKEFGEQLQELTIDERLQLRVKMGKAAVRHIRGMPSAYNDLGDCEAEDDDAWASKRELKKSLIFNACTSKQELEEVFDFQLVDICLFHTFILGLLVV